MASGIQHPKVQLVFVLSETRTGLRPFISDHPLNVNLMEIRPPKWEFGSNSFTWVVGLGDGAS